jgi:hypothetical protein
VLKQYAVYIKKQCGQGRLIKFKSHKRKLLVRRLALLVIIAVACLFRVYPTIDIEQAGNSYNNQHLLRLYHYLFFFCP